MRVLKWENEKAFIEIKYKGIFDSIYFKTYFKEIKRIKSELKAHPEWSRETKTEHGKQIANYRSLLRNQQARYKIKVQLKNPKYQGFTYLTEIEHPINKKFELKSQIKDAIDLALVSFRKRNSHKPEATNQNFGNFIATFQGNRISGNRVFAQSDQVFNLYVKKITQRLYLEKKPEVINRYVGIELEFCAPVTESKLALTLHKAGISDYAQLKKDGSLRPKDGETGFELAILLRENNFKRDLKNICNILKTHKAIAKNRRCGLHVHLDMRRRNKDIVYNNFVACQPALLKVVDPSRSDNEFCRVVESRKFPIEFKGNREERYKTINAAAYYKFKTLEIRMHEGSVDFDQITNWVMLLLKIANHKKKLVDNISNLIILKRRFKLNKKLADYAIERNCHFILTSNNQQRLSGLLFPERLMEAIPSADEEMNRSETNV